jgi:hypothetical protein
MAMGLTPEEYWRANVANRQGLEQEQADAEQAAGGAPDQLDPRQALETYRNLKGQGYDDDQIGRAFERHGWPMPPTGGGSELWRALKRGAYSTAGAGIEGVGATVGSPGMVEYGQGIEKMAEDPGLTPGVSDYTEINKYGGGITRAADDVMRYGANLLGSTLPETAGIAGAGLVAAAAAPEGAAALAAGGIAAFGTSLFPNLGRNVQEQIDRGATPEDVMIGGDGYARAGAAAVGQSALDSFLSTRIAGLVKGGLARASSPNMVRRILKEAAIGAPIEGTTEAAQEALQILQADPHVAALISPEGRQRLISSAVGGALVGGLLEGAAGVLPEREAPAPPPPPRPGIEGGPPPDAIFTEGGTTVGPYGPTPADAGAGTPLGGINQTRIDAQANRAAGDLFTNIRGPIGPATPPAGPRMADLAQGTKDVGILGRALGLEQLLPQDEEQAPAGIEAGMALHAATTAALGDAPAQGPSTAEILEQADQINERARIEREQARLRSRGERAAFEQAFPTVPPVPAGTVPLSPGQTVPQAGGVAAPPPDMPLAGPEPEPPPVGTATPAVPIPPETAPPAAFTATHLDTATNQPVQLAEDGLVRTVRYPDGTVRHERAGKNADRYRSLPAASVAGVPLSPPVHNAPADGVGLTAGGPGPGTTAPPAPPFRQRPPARSSRRCRTRRTRRRRPPTRPTPRSWPWSG